MGGPKTIPFLRVTNPTDRGELDLDDEVLYRWKRTGVPCALQVYPNDVLMNIVGLPLWAGCPGPSRLQSGISIKPLRYFAPLMACCLRLSVTIYRPPLLNSGSRFAPRQRRARPI